MLVNRNKDKQHQRIIRTESSSAENFQSLKSWFRKIEQTTDSISARLYAVEKRLSRNSLQPNDLFQSSDQYELQTENNSRKKSVVKKKDIITIASYVDTEFTAINEDMVTQREEVKKMKENIEVIGETIGMLKQDIQRIQHSISSQLDETSNRIKTIEQKDSLIMHLGAFEIPIEFTGLIGGVLAFLIAFLIVFDKKEIILSPLFICFIGLVLISSALLKIIRRRSKRKNQTIEPTVYPINQEM